VSIIIKTADKQAIQPSEITSESDYLNRRNFIKTGGAAVAGSIIIPPLMQSCQNVQISENVKNYLNHFEVTTQMLQKVIKTAMSKGGDYADLFFEHKISNSLGLQDGEVNRAYSNVAFGVGIRVLKGDQTGFAYSETVSEEAMLNAAKMAANIANSNTSYNAGDIGE
jgi:TldD protein